MAATPSLPRRVFKLAMDNGAHADCLVAGRPTACQSCCEMVEDSLDHFYGLLDTTGEKLVAIAIDFALDIESEQE